jgi:hypothetical protein
MTATHLSPLAGLLAAMLLLSSCDATEPYKREGMWRPEGVVNANIAAQVAYPQDLVRGRGTTEPNYRTAAAAVTKLWGAPAQGGPAGGGAPSAAPASSGGEAGGGQPGAGGALGGLGLGSSK